MPGTQWKGARRRLSNRCDDCAPPLQKRSAAPIPGSLTEARPVSTWPAKRRYKPLPESLVTTKSYQSPVLRRFQYSSLECWWLPAADTSTSHDVPGRPKPGPGEKIGGPKPKPGAPKSGADRKPGTWSKPTGCKPGRGPKPGHAGTSAADTDALTAVSGP